MSEKLETGKLSLAFYVNALTYTHPLYIQHSQVKHTHPPSCSPPPLHHGRRGGGEREIPNHLNLFQLSGQRGVRAIIPPWCIPLPKRIPSLGSAWSAYCVMGTEGTSHPPKTHIKKWITEGCIRNSKAGAQNTLSAAWIVESKMYIFSLIMNGRLARTAEVMREKHEWKQ